METRSYNVYEFKELSEDGQQKALDHLRDGEYFFHEDNKKSLEKFCEIFPVKVKDWEYGYRNFINWELRVDDDIEQLKGLRLAKWLRSNFAHHIWTPKYIGGTGSGKDWKPKYSKTQKTYDCPLTGYYIDHALLDPIVEFIKNPHSDVDLEEIMAECLNGWINACNKDFEYSQSKEAILETIDSNEYRFTKEGKLDICQK